MIAFCVLMLKGKRLSKKTNEEDLKEDLKEDFKVESFQSKKRNLDPS